MQLLLRGVTLCACGFGIGYSPKAPGTLASAAVVPFLLLLGSAGLPAQLLLAVLITGLGVPICAIAARQMGKKDPGAIVWDEFAGMAWAVVGLPDPDSAPYGWVWYVAAFLLFRLFDIWKPGLRALEKLPGGWGIMADDVAAGLFAAIILQLLLLVL